MNLALKYNFIKIFFLCIGLLLIAESCSVQKRRYRKGWTINWRGEQKSNQAKISIKDSLKYASEIETTSITSTKEDLGLIVAEATLKSDSVAQEPIIREVKSNKTVEKARDFELRVSGEKHKKSKVLGEKKRDEPKEEKKSSHYIFFALAAMMFMLAVIAAIVLGPAFLASAAVASSSIHLSLRWFIVVFFYFLMAVFLNQGVKRIRNKKYPEKYEKEDQERNAKKELKRKQKDEMATVGLRDFTWILWVIALVVVTIGIVAWLTLDFVGAILGIMSLIGFFALSQVAILLHIHYKIKVKAFINGEYKPKKRHLEKIAKKKERIEL